MSAHRDDSGAAWLVLDASAPPAADDLVVIAVELAHVAIDHALLDTDEREQAARLRDESLRHDYRAAHTAMRQILGWRLGIDPAQVQVQKDRYGKPWLREHALRFNLSHSGGWALVALAADGDVGVDVEVGRGLRTQEDVAARLFDAAEHMRFLALPPAERTTAFLTAWTRKEAALKALGLGLPGGLEHVRLAEGPLRLCGDFSRHPGLAALHVDDLPRIGTGAAAGWQ